MSKTWRETFLLRTCDCDLTGQWRPGAILTAMQEAAGAHSELLGCGRDALLRDGIVWVASRAEIRMKRYPGIGERLTVETFPMPLRRWFFPRYYVFRDEAGEQIGCAGTLWLLLDWTTRKMAPPDAAARTIPDNSDLTPPMGLPGTVEAVAGEETVSLREPMYFDLDVNQHVNNTRYADWACDALGVDCMRAYCLETLLVNYAREVRPQQKITLRAARDGLRYRVAGYHEDEMVFELGGTLRRRDG